MKTQLFAAALLVLMTVLVLVNSVGIVSAADRYQATLEAFTVNDHPHADVSAYERIYDDFLQTEKWISLTVSHEDLTNIEGAFAEWIGAAKADDKQTAEEMKSRLIDAFRHLGRLAKCNGDSIL